MILRSSALTLKLSQDQIHMKELEHDSLKERSHSKKTRSYQRIEASKLEVWTRLQLPMTTFWTKFHIFVRPAAFICLNAYKMPPFIVFWLMYQYFSLYLCLRPCHISLDTIYMHTKRTLSHCINLFLCFVWSQRNVVLIF